LAFEATLNVILLLFLALMKVKSLLKSIYFFPEYKERLKSSFMRWKKTIDEKNETLSRK
jgi:hypothetical protein